jgi:hypothetical protein
VLVICHSPALTGRRPVNGGHKRIFFCQTAILDVKKDFFSTSTSIGAAIHRFLHRGENQNTRLLAESVIRCSYPLN